MKLGVRAFAWTSKFDRHHLPLIPKVKEMGFSGFEIAMFDPADLAVSDICRAFESSGLECTICAVLPPGINPISPDAQSERSPCSTWCAALRLHPNSALVSWAVPFTRDRIPSRSSADAG